MLDDLVNKTQRQLPHLFRPQIADGMRHLDVGMPIHTLALELEHGRILEGLRNNHRRRNAAFFELYGVVHTAQRARPSSTDGGNRHLHLLGHFVDQGSSSRLGVMLFTAQHYPSHPVVLL